MAIFSDFRPQDRVYHRNCGAGVVTEVTDCVCVQYDDSKTKGRYDRRWFELNPHALNLLRFKDPS